MVGLFHLGSKGSPARTSRSTDTARPMTPPPPPYAQNGHESTYFATETTTTTTHIVTTTQTTTHFFSLPLWRRRPQQPAHSTAASTTPQSASTDELGMILGSPARNLFTRDKDLPPTPPVDQELQTSRGTGSHLPLSEPRHGESSTSHLADARKLSIASMAPSISPLSSGSIPDSTSQGTAALARAALGLGLPPLMFNTLSDSEALPTQDSNNVSFASSPSRTERVPGSSLSPSVSMRRAKSFHRGMEEEQSKSYAEFREQRRTRGLSLGPLLAGSEGVAKEKAVERKPLSRKSSFWSRKRNDSHTPAPIIAPPTNGFLSQPLLPSLQPVSPFNMETSISESSGLRAEQLESPTTDLRRRHSERLPLTRSSRPSAEHDTSDPVGLPQSPQRRRTKRPQTAGSASSPRAVSSFFPGAPTTAEPVSLEVPSEMEANDSETTSPTPLRPRSSTNPPFLHRLSMNLFGSSPNPSPVVNNTAADAFIRSPSTSFSSSSRPSISRSSPKVSIEIPRPRHDEESPELYLQRLTEAVSKAEIAGILASTYVPSLILLPTTWILMFSSADDFHARALRAYIAQFDFRHDPLDVALRRLLMDVGLPRETQQIDRVMEAFAERYRQCHPSLFVSEGENHKACLQIHLIPQLQTTRIFWRSALSCYTPTHSISQTNGK